MGPNFLESTAKADEQVYRWIIDIYGFIDRLFIHECYSRWIDRQDVVIPKYLEYEIGYPDAPCIEGTEYNDIYWLRIPSFDMYFLRVRALIMYWHNICSWAHPKKKTDTLACVDNGILDHQFARRFGHFCFERTFWQSHRRQWLKSMWSIWIRWSCCSHCRTMHGNMESGSWADSRERERWLRWHWWFLGRTVFAHVTSWHGFCLCLRAFFMAYMSMVL